MWFPNLLYFSRNILWDIKLQEHVTKMKIVLQSDFSHIDEPTYLHIPEGLHYQW